LAIPDAAPIIGFVGHLVEQKRPERALDVIAGTRARGEAAHLVVAGDGPLREQLEREVTTRALAPFVHMLGERRDVAAVLGGIDVLISTSASEGVPGVLIEALMAGCPVVALRVGGIATVVDDGVTGLLVEPGALDALADRVAELLRDPSRRDAMSAAGRSRGEMFSARAAARVYAARFEGLLGGRESTPAPPA
jgi:glycosyltransferase involved in cell wall biosynthesis